jgi:hypothetical protein
VTTKELVHNKMLVRLITKMHVVDKLRLFSVCRQDTLLYCIGFCDGYSCSDDRIQ